MKAILYISILLIACLLVWLFVKVIIPRRKAAKAKALQEHQTQLDAALALFNQRIEAAKWLKPEELDSVKWLPADEEIINELKQ